MRWNSSLNLLQAALVDLYPGEDDVQRIATQAGLDIGPVEFDGGAVAMWHSVLQEALKQDRVSALIDQARLEYPSNRKLAAAVTGYQPPPDLPPESPPRRRGVQIWLLLGLIVVALGIGAAIAGGVLVPSDPEKTPSPVVVPTSLPAVSLTEPPSMRPPAASPTEPPPTEPPPTLAPTTEPTQSRDRVADKMAILEQVKYYGEEVKVEATTNLNTTNYRKVLVDPVLTRQLQKVCELRNKNQYYTYKNRDSEIESVTFKDPDHATVLLRIIEDRVQYENGSVKTNWGHENYRAIYTLERQGAQWFINCFNPLTSPNAPIECEVKFISPDPCSQ